MGRPHMLDDLVAQRIVEAVELGAPLYLAAQAGGVTALTLRKWRLRGEAGEEPFAAFLSRLEKARAGGAVNALKVIRKAAEQGTWTAAAWLLERRYPRSFALRRNDAKEKPLTDEESLKCLEELKELGIDDVIASLKQKVEQG